MYALMLPIAGRTSVQRTEARTECTHEAHQPMDTIPDPFVQNLFVLCHGEQAQPDSGVDGTPLNEATARGARPCDPPLTARGKLQAWRVGRKIRLEGWNVTRVVVSPFLRCVQTAVEVVAGLCMLSPDVRALCSADLRGAQLPPPPRQRGSISNIQATIECRLAENLVEGQGMIHYLLEGGAGLDRFQPWVAGVAELCSMLPTEISAPSFLVEPTEKKLPAMDRAGAEDAQCHGHMISTLEKIANGYPHENILCITHGEGVRHSASMMWPPTQIHGVAHCAYTHAQRPIFELDDGTHILNGDWELLTESGSSSGVYCSPNT